jgi:hypothetical protein
MARFAGEFSPIQLSSGASGGNYSAAAGAVDIGNSFAAQREKAPRYDQLSSAAMQTQSNEKQAAMNAESDVMSAGIKSLGDAKVGQMSAQASIKAAEVQAEAEKSKGMMSAFGGIASAGLSLIPGLG